MSESQEQSFSTSVRTHLATLERRDWELWSLALGSLVIMTIGLILTMVPAFFSEDRVIRVSATITPEMLLGLVILIGLLLVYLVSKHLQLRSSRYQSLSETWTHEVSRFQLLFDPLTRVYNRSALQEMVSREISRARRTGTFLTLLYIDIDGFKNVNTKHGHLFGDLVLTEVGSILKGTTRGSDFVVRMGGDEFLVCLIETVAAGGHTVRNRIQNRVEEWNKASPLPGFQLRLSCGVHEFDPNSSFEDALARADRKMYVEKNVVAST